MPLATGDLSNSPNGGVGCRGIRCICLADRSPGICARIVSGASFKGTATACNDLPAPDDHLSAGPDRGVKMTCRRRGCCAGRAPQIIKTRRYWRWCRNRSWSWRRSWRRRGSWNNAGRVPVECDTSILAIPTIDGNAISRTRSNIELNAACSVFTLDDVVVGGNSYKLVQGGAGVNGKRCIEITADGIYGHLTIKRRPPGIPNRFVTSETCVIGLAGLARCAHV